jgi:ferritin
MSICLSYKGYKGAAALFEKYSVEEQTHAQWAYTFLLDLDIRPNVSAIQSPPEEFGDDKTNSLLAAIQTGYKHELAVTQQCDELAKTALEEGKFTVFQLALQYQKEQVEELSKMTQLLDELDTFGTSPEALRLMDNYMLKLSKQ